MIPALLAAGLSIALGVPARALGQHFHLVSWRGTTLTGGLAVLASWWTISLLFGDLVSDMRLLTGLLLAMIPILGIGLWDVRTALRPTPQFLAQCVAAAIAVLIGGTVVRFVTHPLGGLLVLDQWLFASIPLIGVTVSIVWIVIVMNAVNFLDGGDGLAATVSLVGFLTIGAASLLPNVQEPRVALLAFIAAGATGGILFWNYPPARLYLGTTGSWFLGFLLAVLSLLGSSKIATLTVVAAIPLFDALVVVIARLRRGASPFHGDTSHFHHLLVARGWSPRAVVTAYGAASAILGISAVVLPTSAKIGLVALSSIACLPFARHAFHLKHSHG